MLHAMKESLAVVYGRAWSLGKWDRAEEHDRDRLCVTNNICVRKSATFIVMQTDFLHERFNIGVLYHNPSSPKAFAPKREDGGNRQSIGFRHKAQGANGRTLAAEIFASPPRNPALPKSDSQT